MLCNGAANFSIHLHIDFVQDELGMWHWVEREGSHPPVASREGYSNVNDCIKDARRHLIFAKMPVPASIAVSAPGDH